VPPGRCWCGRFETELLIALREKELALNTEAASSVARARALASELPQTLQAERYIKVVEAVPADSTGLPIGADIAFRRSKVQYVAGLDAEIVWLMGGAAGVGVRGPRRVQQAPVGTGDTDLRARASPSALRRSTVVFRRGRPLARAQAPSAG
jgi:hypothetical protein